MNDLDKRLKAKPVAPPCPVCRHDGVASVGTDDSDQQVELIHHEGVIARPNADSHSPGYAIPAKVTFSSRSLPKKLKT
jgi:hypothetical protein